LAGQSAYAFGLISAIAVVDNAIIKQENAERLIKEVSRASR
jgi:multidrug efflux pump subunit AcrB